MKPIHPMLVHFPLALIVLAVVADGSFFFTREESMRHGGWWVLAAGAVGAVATSAAGIWDMRRATLADEVHVRVHRHMKMGLLLSAAMIALAAWRWTIFIDRSAYVSAIYLDCAIVVMAVALFQGWLGGELVYSHGVFVKEASPRGGAKPAGSRGKTGHHH